jgi:hypothetical protein
MNPFDKYLFDILLLLLAIIFLTIGLSYLALLIRFCPKHRRLILVRSATDVTVLGPGWVFLKPYRERLLKIDIRVQHGEVEQPLFQANKILYSFKVSDAQKSATAALQYAERVLEQSKISDRQKEVIRYSREYNFLTENLRFLTKTLVALSYINFTKELKVDNGIASNDVLERCRTELDGLFLENGLQLINIYFSSDNDAQKQ